MSNSFVQNFPCSKMHFKMRLPLVAIVFLLIAASYTVWVLQHRTVREAVPNSEQHLPNSTDPHNQIVLFWNGFTYKFSYMLPCGSNACMFSSDRNLLGVAKVLVITAPFANLTNFPVPRLPHQLWALYMHLSPIETRYLGFVPMMQHFNYSATFSRFSDFPLTRSWLWSFTLLTTHEYMLPVTEKSRLRKEGRLAPVLFLQSRPNTWSGREDFVFELMRYIAIDSYGASLNNKQLPHSLSEDYNMKFYTPDILKFMGRYKFILAYENAVCDDYISEKFWRPLVVGAIPVYFGAPNIADWAPNNKSFININDFETPGALATFLMELDHNDAEYVSYLSHKYDPIERIANQRLRYSPISAHQRNGMDFGCYMCAVISKSSPPVSAKMVTQSHYNCSQSRTVPSMIRGLVNVENTLQIRLVASMTNCTAISLDRIIRLNKPYSKTDLDYC